MGLNIFQPAIEREEGNPEKLPPNDVKDTACNKSRGKKW